MAKNEKALDCLNKIFQAETTGIVRYLHYSFMIMGHNRIPIQKWFRDQAQEAIDHAVIIGEKITSMDGHPPLVFPKVEESNNHNVDHILKESLHFEEEALALYKQLVVIASENGDIALEELARSFVRNESDHTDEVRKMLKRE
jgi:bacterioferritin